VSGMGRREFITLFGGVAAWPLVARAQQPAMPVIGFLHPASPERFADRLRGFRQGLKETGYVEGENVAIDFRWAENQIDRLPELAAELVRRRVSVIATGGDNAAAVAKAAIRAIPTVFIVSQDPVKLGLVESLARPSGNMTGFNFLSGEVSAKRLGFLHELLPGAVRIAVLVHPTDNPVSRESAVRDLEAGARVLGLQIHVLDASTNREIEAAFATLVRDRHDAMVINPDPFFGTRLVKLANLAARHGVPAIYSGREFAEVGGLMTYGIDIVDVWRQSGVYVGRILKGTKPTDLPVVQSSKFQLVINAATARMFGLTIPPGLLAITDEVIE
jgi:putative tryptophan/tyrosine transport system substrate-binding protein